MLVQLVTWLALWPMSSAPEASQPEGTSDTLGTVVFGVPWYSIAGGGGLESRGGEFELDGTIGQPGTGKMKGGNYALVGGFWAIAHESPFFHDGFESGDTSKWSLTVAIQVE